MKWPSYLLLFVVISLTACVRAQPVPDNLKTGYPPLDDKLAKMIEADEHAINPAEARQMPDAVFLDAREVEEFNTSHLPGALFLGFNDINYSVLNSIKKNTPLIVYCTVGYRSEKVATKLRDRGYTNVSNLYGSLYAWKLAGFPLVDAAGQETEKLHTYNKKWGTYVPDEIGEKVY